MSSVTETIDFAPVTMNSAAALMVSVPETIDSGAESMHSSADPMVSGSETMVSVAGTMRSVAEMTTYWRRNRPVGVTYGRQSAAEIVSLRFSGSNSATSSFPAASLRLR